MPRDQVVSITSEISQDGGMFGHTAYKWGDMIVLKDPIKYGANHMNNLWMIIGGAGPGKWNLSAYYDTIKNKYITVAESEIYRKSLFKQ